MLTNEQAAQVEAKYGRLIHAISNAISGDKAISSHSDNVQDLWVAVMEAVRGFSKKEQQEFEDFWGTTGFDKYLKTCLWNVKNSKGARITKRYPLTKSTVSLQQHAEVFALEDSHSGCSESDVFLDEFSNLLTNDEQRAVQHLLDDPNNLMPSGRANVASLARDLEMSWNDTKNILDDLGVKLNNEL